MNKLRFAIVGCGRIAKKHIEAIGKLEDAELVSVCDINEERAKHYGIKLGIPYYVDYHDMLKNHEVDVVNILTPSGLHAKHIIDIASRYRKHIICEKPLALSIKDADEAIRVCEENQVYLFVVMQNRFNIAVQQLRKTLEQGRLGKIVLGSIRVRWARTQEYYNADAWRGTWELDGGSLTNQASHHIDLLVWMMGEPIEVSGKIARRLLDIEAEDTAGAVIRFADGSLGIVEVTTATRPTDLEGSISILGEHGTVEIGGFAANEITTWAFTHPIEEDKEIMIAHRENPPDVYGYGHIRYFEHIIDCIRNHTAPLVDGREARKSLELIHAIYESAITGNTIQLRFIPKRSPLGGGQHE